MKDDLLEINGEKHSLNTTSKGHYMLPLARCNYVEVNSTEPVNQTTKEKRAMVKKLHRQFGHVHPDSLKNLIKNAGKYDEELSKMIDEVYEKCKFCIRYRKTKPRPVVCLPLALRFNEVVAMDLKYFNRGMNFIHFIDMFTRFSKAKVIRSKKPAVVVKAFIMEWIGMGFGAPQRVLVDNGGEFDNPIYLDAMQQYNIEPLATAANI